MTRQRRISRLVVRAAVSLVVGVVISLAVAWGSAALCEWPGAGRPLPLRITLDSTTPPRLSDYYEKVHSMADRVAGVGLRRTRYMLEDGPLSSDAAYLEIFEAGWPMAALEWTDVVDIFGDSLVTDQYLRPRGSMAWDQAWEYGVSVGWDEWRRVPLRACRMGLGLAVDAVVWGAVAAGAVTLAGAVRRRRRWRRGRCVGCGYLVRGTDGQTLQRCPECGADA